MFRKLISNTINKSFHIMANHRIALTKDIYNLDQCLNMFCSLF